MSFGPFPILLHATALSVMTYGYMALPQVLAGNIPIHELKGGHFQFLTIQGLCVAWLTMALSLGCDFFPSSRILKTTKRALLMGALPLSIVISAIYWTLLLAMPHLILLEDPEPSSASAMPPPARLPLHVDLALHAVPAISSIIDFYSLERKYSKKVSVYGAIALASVLGTWYACWVEYCASYNGFFPYPFLTNNPYNIRVRIYAAASLFAAVAFMLLNALHR